MTENLEENAKQVLPASVYLVGALTQFAVGLHAPFLQAYMIDMNATNFQLGAFRSVGNAAPSILQPVWGATSDKVGRNKPFVAFGLSTGLFLVVLFLWAATPVDMIILYAVQSILFSVQIPTWLSLAGGLMGEKNRGSELGKLGVATNIASLLATLVSGFIAGFPAIIPALRLAFGDFGPILFPTVESWRESYYILFYFTAVIGIIASLMSLGIKEHRHEKREKRDFPPLMRLLSQPGDFRRLCAVGAFFSFAMSIAWPYFIRVQREWLNQSLIEIAIASAIMTMTTVLFTIPLGKVSDRVGRKPLIVLGRGLLFAVPLIYGISSYFPLPNLAIYGANMLVGFCVAAATNATTTYIYDIAPKEERGSYLAVFNTFSGIIYFLGCLFGGYLGDVIDLLMGSYMAVFLMLLLSAILRFVGSFFYLLLEEPKQYTSTMWLELQAFVNRRRMERDTA